MTGTRPWPCRKTRPGSRGHTMRTTHAQSLVPRSHNRGSGESLPRCSVEWVHERRARRAKFPSACAPRHRAPCARGGGADTHRSSGRSHSLLSWLPTSVSAPKRLAMAVRDLATRTARAAVGSIGAQRAAQVNTVAPQRASADRTPRCWPTRGVTTLASHHCYGWTRCRRGVALGRTRDRRRDAARAAGLGGLQPRGATSLPIAPGFGLQHIGATLIRPRDFASIRATPRRRQRCTQKLPYSSTRSTRPATTSTPARSSLGRSSSTTEATRKSHARRCNTRQPRHTWVHDWCFVSCARYPERQKRYLRAVQEDALS